MIYPLERSSMMTGRKAFVLFLSFILIFSFLFPLVSCSGKQAGTETDPISPSGTEASSEPTHSEPDTAEPSSEGGSEEAVTEEALLSSGFPLLRIEIILSLERLRKFDYDTFRNHRHTF
jgi:hypothetical protein